MPKIVVVEDEKTERDALVTLLNTGYEDYFQDISVAITGTQAVDTILDVKPDFLLLDIHLPGKNGLEVLEEIRQSFPETEVAIITAYNHFEYARQSISLGVRDYLLKPVSLKDFYLTIDLMIANYEKRKRITSCLKDLEITEQMREWMTSVYSDKGVDKLFNAFSLLSLSGSTESASKLILSHLNHNREMQDDIVAFSRSLVHFLTSYFKSLDLPANDLFRDMDETFLDDVRNGHFSFQGVQQFTNRFLLNVNRYLESCENYSNHKAIILEINHWLEENYMNNINLNKLAVKTQRNPAYISHLYKKETGINIKDKIKSIRIRHAKELLETGEYSIKEVAYSTGFSDPNYFSMVFKKETGVHASDYFLYYGKKI